jgi:glycosyltransferase involved in cell wall biosynthesis
MTDQFHASNTSAPAINILVHGSGNYAGVWHDAELLRKGLAGVGQRVSVLDRPTFKTFTWRVMGSRKARALRFDRVLHYGLMAVARTRRRLNRQPHNVEIHLEYVSPRHLIDGAVQMLLPNPEHFSHRDAWALRFIDAVLCKTRHAMPIFEAAGCAVKYIGFTSGDCHVPGIVPDRSRWLHVASNRHQKGTYEIVDAWHRHPEWPHLTVVAGRRSEPIAAASNLHVTYSWLDEEQLHTLMQRSGVHLCPSNAEGFGHTIVEAMSCGVLVLTTDLEPMNELLDESRGILVDVAETAPMGWGRRAKVGQGALEAAVERAIALSDSEYACKANAARQWYLENDAAFRRRLEDFAEGVRTAALE